MTKRNKGRDGIEGHLAISWLDRTVFGKGLEIMMIRETNNNCLNENHCLLSETTKIVDDNNSNFRVNQQLLPLKGATFADNNNNKRAANYLATFSKQKTQIQRK